MRGCYTDGDWRYEPEADPPEDEPEPCPACDASIPYLCDDCTPTEDDHHGDDPPHLQAP